MKNTKTICNKFKRSSKDQARTALRRAEAAYNETQELNDSQSYRSFEHGRAAAAAAARHIAACTSATQLRMRWSSRVNRKKAFSHHVFSRLHSLSKVGARGEARGATPQPGHVVCGRLHGQEAVFLPSRWGQQAAAMPRRGHGPSAAHGCRVPRPIRGELCVLLRVPGWRAKRRLHQGLQQRADARRRRGCSWPEQRSKYCRRWFLLRAFLAALGCIFGFSRGFRLSGRER